MKAIITITAGLMIASATFAQSSRRTTSKENNDQQNNNSSRTESVKTNSESRRSAGGPSYNSSQVSANRAAGTRTGDRSPQPSNTGSRPVYTNNDHGQQNNRGGQPSQNDQHNNNDSRNNNGYASYNRNGSYNNNHEYDNNRRDDHDSHNRVVVIQDRNRMEEARHHYVEHRNYQPVPLNVRRVKYPYRVPVRGDIIWSIELSRNFEIYYPDFRPYRYHYGMRLANISAYDAFDYVGEVARVYGRVIDTYYSYDTDEYFLYFGDYYPYQDFSVVIPGREAREFSPRPERYFTTENIEVTGYITRFDGKPELVVRNASQLNVY